MAAAPPHLLYLVTEDWAFLSHRLPMARAALAAGFRVSVACRVNSPETRAKIEAEGVAVLPLHRLERASLNPLKELRAVAELVRLYRREKPDLLHHVALKPCLLGSLAARLAGGIPAVNAMIGMGFLFTAASLKARLLRPVVRLALAALVDRRNSRLLVQNDDDRTLFAASGLVAAERIVLIPGSGVETRAFTPPNPEPPAPPVVALCAARLLWDKGLGELVEAARLLNGDGVPLKIRVAGDRDPANPRCIPEQTRDAWTAEGLVEFLGKRTDMADLYRASHIAVLPSHREGMPKALLEGAACGRPLVATDAPGCRALVRPGENGLLVPVGDAKALALALRTLTEDPTLRHKLGAAARRDAEQVYSDGAVGAAITTLYQ